MIKTNFTKLILISGFGLMACNPKITSSNDGLSSSTNKNINSSINTADEALKELIDGNKRFLKGTLINTNYKKAIDETKQDQNPHSLILSCLDSRIPPEIIFDQGIGKIFVARVAGNVEDDNILGSMEFATKVKNTKLIVVMGHSKCGAVRGAIENAQLENLTQLLNQIKPSIAENIKDRDVMMNETAKNNVNHTIKDILEKSKTLNDLVKQEKVKIVGAFYDINTGEVIFL